MENSKNAHSERCPISGTTCVANQAFQIHSEGGGRYMLAGEVTAEGAEMNLLRSRIHTLQAWHISELLRLCGELGLEVSSLLQRPISETPRGPQSGDRR